MAKILEFNSVTKNNKTFYIVRIYLSWSEVVQTCFVSSDVFNSLKTGEINDKNIIEHLSYKVNKDNQFYLYIKK